MCGGGFGLGRRLSPTARPPDVPYEASAKGKEKSQDEFYGEFLIRVRRRWL